MSATGRIAFLCHPYHRGGVTSWMRDAAIAYALQGKEVYFVTVDPVKPFHSGKDREKMVDMVRKGGVRIGLVSAPVNYAFEFGTDEYRATVYSELVRRQVPTGTPLIVSDDFSVWKAAAAIADVYPMVGVLHGDQDHYYNKAIAHQAQLSVCACVSGRIKRKVMEHCAGIGASRFHTIPCGIDLPAFAPVGEQSEVRKLIFIGRITDPDKRAEDLVHICAALHKQGKRFHLDIVGSDESTAPEYVRMFREAGVSEEITFHGWRTKEEIHKLLGRSDVLLLTSNSEGMPLVMMEALGAGCGFVGTRVSGIEDYEHDTRSANCLAVYTVGDIDDAIAKIDSVISVPADVRTVSARKLGEEEFSMAVCLDKYSSAIAAIDDTKVKPLPVVLSLPARLYSIGLAKLRRLKLKATS